MALGGSLYLLESQFPHQLTAQLGGGPLPRLAQGWSLTTSVLSSLLRSVYKHSRPPTNAPSPCLVLARWWAQTRSPGSPLSLGKTNHKQNPVNCRMGGRCRAGDARCSPGCTIRGTQGRTQRGNEEQEQRPAPRRAEGRGEAAALGPGHRAHLTSRGGGHHLALGQRQPLSGGPSWGH